MNTQELFQHAKDDLLTDGNHAPMMYVEYDDKDGKSSIDLYYFADFGAETPLEEHKQFFALGAKFGAEHGSVDFSQLTFIAEAWVSQVKPGHEREFQRKYKRPHNDPNRKEYLTAQVVELMPTPDGKKEMRQSLLRAEIVRPAKDVIDLVPDNSEFHVSRLLFPSYFLAGYSSSQISDAELQEVMKSVLKESR